MAQTRFDIHQHITDQIVAAIEKGAGDFRLPWHRSGSITRPVNVSSKKAYRGVNIVSLWAASEHCGFSTGLWGTYRQWAEAGAQVRKGEKASYVVFYKEFEVAPSGESTDDETETRLFAKATPVFAAEQVDGFELPPAPTATVIDPVIAADELLKATKAIVNYGGDRAFYRPSTDAIHMPNPSSFVGTTTSTPQEAFYSTILHELTHWTSHKDRLNRELGKRFGDKAYAVEELIAELGAAFLCSELGVTSEPRKDHAQYLSSWLDVLKADKKAIFSAASSASKATDFLLQMKT